MTVKHPVNKEREREREEVKEGLVDAIFTLRKQYDKERRVKHKPIVIRVK